MNFGFDLDKVFVDYPPFMSSKIIDSLYKKRSNGSLLYRIPSRPEQLLRILSHFSPLRPPITRNIDFLKQLTKNTTHKYYLISSRFSFLEKTTDRLMKKQGFKKLFHSMVFNFEDLQPHIFKDRAIKKFHIDRYVDDDLDLLQYLAKHNPQTVFYWLNGDVDKNLEKNLLAISDISKITE